MGFFDRFRKPKPAEHQCVDIEWSFSKLAQERKADPRPVICFGHAMPLGKFISENSTLNTIHVDEPSKIAHVCTCPAFKNVGIEFVGIIAQSRNGHPGEAAEALRSFETNNARRGALIYGAWDYNVQRAAQHAIDCGADAVLMPGIDTNEMFKLIFGVIGRVQQGAPKPQTVEEHTALLRELTTEKSPFWKNQDAVVSPNH